MIGRTDLTETSLPRFDDVELGDEIGPMETEATDEAVLAFCRAWGDLQYTPNRFTDPKIAVDNGLPGPIVPGIMALAMMARMLTEWAGVASIRDLDAVFRQPVPHHAPVTIAGIVTDIRREDGENLVECDVLMTGAQAERYVTAKTTLALPI